MTRLRAHIANEVGAQVAVKVPGLALVVVSPDRVEAAEAWGQADLASGLAMQPQTVCNWFSMTKPVTATAVMQLADRGLVDLDRSVRDYYPGFSVAGPRSRSRAATVRHLLSHSSGLTNPIPTRWIHLADDAGPDRHDFVRSVLKRHSRLRFDPGSDAKYSNLGYLVLGEVIEVAAGQPYESYVEQNVLRPLNMEHTGFSANQGGEPWATPYQRRRSVLNALLPVLVPRAVIGRNHGRFRALRHFHLDGASYGGLIGPATDAARFVQAHLADGILDDTRILSAESTRAMRTIQACGKGIEAGIGWYRRGGGQGGPDFVEHLGGGAGFWNCMRLYPGYNVGLVMMGNATKYDHDLIATAVFESIAGDQSLDRS